ncbi:MAG TPA: Rossmann-like and DUF2520 domain-containing protein, partial [Polyangiales bacterium]|nr:Rossmann-like and DUF2520 domain-containing protein [Polyangiales bacterium]
AAAGVTQIAVATRERAAAEQFASKLGAGVQAVDASKIADAADLVFLAVPDAAVRDTCDVLPLTATHAVVHLSGVLGLDCLAPAAERGAMVGALHPLQAFPADSPEARFRGIYTGIEASDPALTARLEAIARALGATPFSLAGVDRAAYHAAAVLTSNYVVALHAAAAEVWRLAGLPPSAARAALAPLTLGAAQAISERELPQALTGPIARGDVRSVESHLEVLRADSERAALYRALARELLRLPLGLSTEAQHALAALVEEPTSS